MMSLDFKNQKRAELKRACPSQSSLLVSISMISSKITDSIHSSEVKISKSSQGRSDTPLRGTEGKGLRARKRKTLRQTPTTNNRKRTQTTTFQKDIPGTVKTTVDSQETVTESAK